jgi:hypothetical protein
MSGEIDRYMALLARRLSVPAEERETILQEIHSHLEERVAVALADGQDQQAAERAAIQAFGDARQVAVRFTAVYGVQPVQWKMLNYLGAGALGVAALWGIWTLGTLPAYVYYFTVYPVFTAGQQIEPSLMSEIIQSSPISSGGFAAYLLLGWLWLLPLIALFGAAPFLWARRADRWWGPALAYGVGAWLSAPWFVFFLFGSSIEWEAEARIIALALPVALVAAALGALVGRRRRAQIAALAAMRVA